MICGRSGHKENLVSLETDITEIRKLLEADVPEVPKKKGLFKPASPEQVRVRRDDYSQQAAAGHQAWVETARAELAQVLGVAVVMDDGYDTTEGISMTAVQGKGNNGESEWIVFSNTQAAEDFAIAQVKGDLESDPGMFSQDWLQNMITIGNADRRLMAGEEADYIVDDMEEEQLIEDAGMTEEYAELVDDVQKEEMLDAAKDTVREKNYDEIYNALGDPIQYFVHDRGVYSVDELLKASFIQIDVEVAARDAVDTDGVAHFLDRYDGSETELPSGAVAYGTN